MLTDSAMILSPLLAAGDTSAIQAQLAKVVLLTGAALVTAWLMRLARAPAIVGFLVAGVLIGQITHIKTDDVRFFAELGLALLLFSVGLELSPAPLIERGRQLLFASLGQLALCLIAGAVGVLIVGGVSLGPALLIGCAVALSSTAITLKQLGDRREVETVHGTIATGTLLVQDVAVIALLLVLPLIAGQREDGAGSVVVESLIAVGGLVLVVLAARWCLPWLLESIFRGGGRELLTLFAVTFACLGAYLAGLANWSWALGACIAGLLLAMTDLRHQLHAEIAPFRDLFNAIFFLSIGMLVDINLIATRWPLVFGAVAATLIIKSLLTASAVRMAGWPWRIGLTVGLSLASISEFGYVLVDQATQLGLLQSETLKLLVAITVGTMLAGAALGQAATALARWMTPGGSGMAPSTAGTQAARHVIIVGFGVNGANLARVLRETGIEHVVIEMNRTLANTARAGGAPTVVGDATRGAILEHAGLETAGALVVCINDNAATRRIVRQAAAMRPDLYILARTRFLSELDVLYRCGARQVIPEEFETSIELFAHVLKEYSVPDNVVSQQITLIRAGRYGMLRGLPADRDVRLEMLHALEQTGTQTFLIDANSPVRGRTLREVDLRARTSVTLVAVTRRGAAIAPPTADLAFEVGDVLVLVGSHANLDAARQLLSAPADDAADRAR